MLIVGVLGSAMNFGWYCNGERCSVGGEFWLNLVKVLGDSEGESCDLTC